MREGSKPARSLWYRASVRGLPSTHSSGTTPRAAKLSCDDRRLLFALHAAAEGGLLLIWREPEAGKAALLAGLAELGPEFKFPKRVLREAMAWLPSRDGAAVPSSPLLNGGAVGVEAGCRIAQYPVTVLPLAAPGGDRSAGATCGQADGRSGRTRRGRSCLLDRGAKTRRRAGLTRSVSGPGDRARGGRIRSPPGNRRRLGPNLPGCTRWLVRCPLRRGRSASVKRTRRRRIPAVTVLTRFVGSVVDSLVRSAAASSAPSFVECLHDRWLRGARLEKSWHRRHSRGN